MIVALANSMWLGGCLPELARFHRASRHVAEEQRAILRRLLAANADTEFGRLHGFSPRWSVSEYQRNVPLRDYDGFAEWIGRAAAGAPNVLTREPVRLFEPTSGSCGGAKLIPHTRSLQREFQRGIRAWIADLFLDSPDLLAGPAYWSVSPSAAGRRTTPGGIPVGFEEDTAYVGGWQHRLLNAVMAVPNDVRLASDLSAFHYATLLHLLRARDLKLISIWNPSFLTLMLDRLPEWSERLIYDLRGVRDVREALHAHTPQERFARLWPKLGLISCWTDANAAAPAARLRNLFPQARVQGKGLIATEGFISFPLSGCDGAVLSPRSHFIEFLPAGSGQPLLAHELERGGGYAVVLTTGGGLYRYQLDDLIEVLGHFHGCPLIRFLGRQSYVSDWFGEKLHEAHVARIFEDVFPALGIRPDFAMLACDTDSPDPGYVLYIDAPEPDELLDRASQMIEARLGENFHYHYARQLRQLAAVRALRVEDGARAYLAAALENGQRAGDVKPPALDRRNGWSRMMINVASL